MAPLLRILALMLLVLPASAQDADRLEERYYVMLLGDERSGWMHERVTRTADTITTAADMRFEVKRGPIELSIGMETEFVETADHRPISMRFLQRLAALPLLTTYEFLPESVRVVSDQAGHRSESIAPLPAGEWLTPSQATERLRRAIAEGEQSFTLRSIDPSVGLDPVEARVSELSEAVVEVFGKTVPAYRSVAELSVIPGAPTESFVDAQGNLLRSVTSIGGLTITMLAADRELALAEIDPPEMMLSTLIKPDRPVRSPRDSRRGVYLVSLPEGEIDRFPGTAAQSVERVDQRTLRITVDTARPFPSGEPPTEAETAPSLMLNAVDERITTLLPKARPIGDAPAEVRAESIRRFVHEYVDEKSLEVGIASATEVAMTRVGDCTEHAVLLAALLRADGIPSRVATGVVYVDEFIGARGIFGYHMWTQAWLDTGDGGAWVDLDAAIDPSAPFDATHITLSVDPMSDPSAVNSLVTLLPLLGAMRIEVEAVE